jgi:predicted dehydrogenase
MKRILIVGLGSIGKRHLVLARRFLPQADIRILRHQFSTDLPCEANGVFFNISDALAFSPQAAVIANPASFHMESATALIKTGCHLLIEKPLSNHPANIERFFKSVETCEAVTLVGYNLRFLSALKYFKQFIEEGELGKILSVRSEAGNHLPSWRPGTDYRQGVSAQKILGGGVLLELSHELDYLRWIFGEITWVSGWTGQLSDLELDVEDTANLILGIGEVKPILCSLNLDFVRHDPVRSCTVIGELGSLRWNGMLGIVERWNIANGVWDLLFSAENDLEQSYYREWEHFLDSINNNRAPLVTLADGAATLNVIEAARESSANSGSRVFLDGYK